MFFKKVHSYSIARAQLHVNVHTEKFLHSIVTEAAELGVRRALSGQKGGCDCKSQKSDQVTLPWKSSSCQGRLYFPDYPT